MMEKYQSVEAIIAEFSYLLKPFKKVPKKIAAPIETIEPEENLLMIPLEKDFARSSFFREYLSPVVVDKEK